MVPLADLQWTGNQTMIESRYPISGTSQVATPSNLQKLYTYSLKC